MTKPEATKVLMFGPCVLLRSSRLGGRKIRGSGRSLLLFTHGYAHHCRYDLPNDGSGVGIGLTRPGEGATKTAAAAIAATILPGV